MATKQEIKIIPCFCPKTFSHAILYVYRVSFFLIQKKNNAVITLILPIFGCEQVQPLSLNLMPTLALSEPLVLSSVLFFFFIAPGAASVPRDAEQGASSCQAQGQAPKQRGSPGRSADQRPFSKPGGRESDFVGNALFYKRRLCGRHRNSRSWGKAEARKRVALAGVEKVVHGDQYSGGLDTGRELEAFASRGRQTPHFML